MFTRFDRMPVVRLVLLGFALTALAACASGPEPDSNLYGLNAELRGAPPVRMWTEPAFEQTAILSGNDDYTLYNPAELYIPDGKRLYVWDAGDNRLKLFTPDGEYVRAYGNGPGNGPGEIQVYKNVGLWRDSLYVLDPQNRRLSFFSEGGTFGSSEQYRRHVSNVAWTGDSTRYEIFKGPGVPFTVDIITPSGRETTVSHLQTRDFSSIVLGGILHAADDRAVYVPYYYPLLLTFAPGDTTARAYPTPDYGAAPIPEPRVEGEPGRQMIRPPSRQLHVRSILHDGVLAVQVPAAEDSLAFDVYNTREMRHMHSVRLPIANGSALYAYSSGLLAVERDTTVEVYNVKPPRKEAL